ncbi:MAG: pyridoxal-phosphate dependent enzyme [Pseudanabaenales cyanobacterium]|nr:pyridoxal-phosphate dependent enzyme [Pseudanabaenales cyanobacterium]
MLTTHLDDFRDQQLDYWVTGFGTGGTLKGTARVLKAERPKTQVVVCEPDNSQLMASGLPQKRGENGGIHESHQTQIGFGSLNPNTTYLALSRFRTNLL